MLRISADYEPYAYAIMRIIFGLLFLCHGLQKAVGAFGGINGAGLPAPFFSLLGIAGWLEVLLGLMVALGALTSLAAFLASGEMAVAYFIAHFPQGFWPIMNQGVDTVLYCFIFLYIAAHGPGNWSIDTFGADTH